MTTSRSPVDSATGVPVLRKSRRDWFEPLRGRAGQGQCGQLGSDQGLRQGQHSDPGAWVLAA